MMTQLFMLVALWCGSPSVTGTTAGYSHEVRSNRDVQQCRERVLSCIGKVNFSVTSKQLECVTKEKI